MKNKWIHRMSGHASQLAVNMARLRLASLAGLLLVAMTLSGCVIRPIAAGPLEQAPLPSDQGPIIAIAPIAAASGETVSVSGAGWEPNEVVFVNLEGVQDGESVQATLVSGTTDAEGRFFWVFVTPLDFFWRDVIDLQVVARSLQGDRSAAAPFELLVREQTATPPPTPTPYPPVPPAAPTRDAQDLGYGVATVSSRGLNMRSGPGIVYPVIRTLTYGTRIGVLGQDATGTWLFGQLWDGTRGWVARAFTDYLGSPPVVAAPPTPTLLPSATPTRTPIPTPTPPAGLAWRGEYYDNPSQMGAPRLVRHDPAINFNWGFAAPAPGIPATGFSVRWSRPLYFAAGTYRFFGESDGGVRIWVDNRLVLDQWTGVAGAYRTDVWLDQGSYTIYIDYGQRRQPAYMTFGWTRLEPTPPPAFPDWRGEYFNNRHLSGAPVHVRNDRAIDFNWTNVSPAPGVGTVEYSVRWSRTLDFTGGDYRFYVRSDDGVRIYVDGQRIIDEWRDMSGSTTYTADRRLDGRHHIVVEYYQNRGAALITFWWERLQATPTPTRTPTPTNTPTLPPTPNPFADANPSSGPVDTQVTVSFGGFPPNTAVNLYLGAYVRAADAASATIYASGSSDRFGNGSLRFTVPTTWPDGSPVPPGKLALLVATSDFRVSAAADFDVTQPRPTVAPNPYIEANPNSGGPGTQVTVRGGGFPANRTINLYLGSVVRASALGAVPPIQTTASDVNGNFTAQITIPARWSDGSLIPTGKLIILAATADFAAQATATFDFFATPANPSINLAPASGPAGTRVVASGSGFPANTAVAVYLAHLDTSIGEGALMAYVSGQTDRDGRYALIFTMPATWPDGSAITQDRIVVTVATPDFSVAVSSVFAYQVAVPTPTNTPTPVLTSTPTSTPLASPTPTLNPYAQVSPGSGQPGITVTVSGGGFPPNTMLYAHLVRLDGSVGEGESYARYASAPSDALGNFLMSFVMPATWPNGTVIATQRLVILVATDDFSVQAGVTFNFEQLRAAGESPPEESTATPPPPEEPAGGG